MRKTFFLLVGLPAAFALGLLAAHSAPAPARAPLKVPAVETQSVRLVSKDGTCSLVMQAGDDAVTLSVGMEKKKIILHAGRFTGVYMGAYSGASSYPEFAVSAQDDTFSWQVTDEKGRFFFFGPEELAKLHKEARR